MQAAVRAPCAGQRGVLSVTQRPQPAGTRHLQQTPLVMTQRRRCNVCDSAVLP